MRGDNMAATIIDGKATAAAIKDELRERVSALTQKGITPGLATVLIGDDPSSHAYVRNKHRAGAGRVARLNADPKVDGFLIQHPVPGHLDYSELVIAVDPAKDVDGLHPTN